MRRILRLLMCVLLAGLGAFMIYAGVDIHRTRAALDERGVAAEGTVSQGWTKRRRWGGRNYMLDVRYRAGETVMTEDVRVSEQIYDAHIDERNQVLAAPIRLRYLPEDPRRVRVVGFDEDPRVPIVFGCVAILSGLFVGIRTLRNAMHGR